MELITQIRKTHDVTQEQFARELSKVLEPIKGMTSTTIRNWENGRTIPDYFMLFYVTQQDCPRWLKEFAEGAMGILRSQAQKSPQDVSTPN